MLRPSHPCGRALLRGEEITDGAGETVTFALDGTTYEIDPSTDNATQLREVFAAYTSAGRKTSGRTIGGASQRRTTPSSKTTINTGPDPRTVRDWAAKNGIELSSRPAASPSRSSPSTKPPSTEAQEHRLPL